MLFLQCRFTVGQLSVSCWYTVGQLSVSCRFTVGQLSVSCWYTVGQLSVSCRFTVGQLSVSCWYTVGQLSADRKPTVGQQTFRGALLHFYPTIFLDRDGHLHCQTIKEKHGLPFCSWVQSGTGKPYMSMFSFFSAIFAGPRFVENQKFGYHGNVTWRLLFSMKKIS